MSVEVGQKWTCQALRQRNGLLGYNKVYVVLAIASDTEGKQYVVFDNKQTWNEYRYVCDTARMSDRFGFFKDGVIDWTNPIMAEIGAKCSLVDKAELLGRKVWTYPFAIPIEKWWDKKFKLVVGEGDRA